MCGRYELHSHPAAIALAFGLAHSPDVQARYNIAPMTEVPVIRIGNDARRELVRMRWGLVPRWAKDPSIGARMINARAESLPEKVSFKLAFQRHRCLLPADGFYEWRDVAAPHPHKEPLHIGMKNGALFGLAGLYERWLSEEGAVLNTCTIVTTEANSMMRKLHDRMPVIIAPGDYARWLDPAHPAGDDLLAPYPAGEMAWYPVSTRVNAVRNDDPTLINPVAAAHLASGEGLPAPRDDPEQESLF